jgi:hypothetical protein
MKVLRLSSPEQIMSFENNWKIWNISTICARCTCEIESRIAMAKAAYNKIFSGSKLAINLRRKVAKCYV